MIAALTAALELPVAAIRPGNAGGLFVGGGVIDAISRRFGELIDVEDIVRKLDPGLHAGVGCGNAVVAITEEQ